MFRIHLHRVLVEPAASVVRDETTGATLHIEGLVCSACATRVRQRLEQVPGVRSAEVELDSGEARVVYDEGAATAPEALIRAVEGAVVLRPLRRLLARLAIGRPRAAAGLTHR